MPPRGAGRRHLRPAEQVAVGAVGHGLRVEPADRDRIFLIGHEHPRPFAAGKAILGAPVDAAVLLPAELDFLVRGTGDPAAGQVESAHQRAVRCSEGALITVSLRLGGQFCRDPAVDFVEPRAGKPQRGGDHHRHRRHRARDHHPPLRCGIGFAIRHPRAPCDRTGPGGDQHQQERQCHHVLSGGLHLLGGLQPGALARFTGLFAARLELAGGLHFLAREAGLLGFVEFAEAAAGQIVDLRGDPVCLEERQQLAGRDGEEELRVRRVALRPEAVDPDHPPARVDQRAARIAARDRGGVEQGVELTAGARTGEVPTALHRWLRAEDVAEVEPLRTVDIHRIADRDHVAAVARRIGGDGQRRQAQRAGQLDQGEVVARADRKDAGIDRLVAFRRDHADPQAIVHRRCAHHMGVSDNPARGDSEPGTMAERDHLVPLAPDNHHPHHPARSGVDIRRVGTRRSRCEEREHRGEESEQADHHPFTDRLAV